MENLNSFIAIKSAIKNELRMLKQDKMAYEGTEKQIAIQTLINDSLKALIGWDWDKNDQAKAFFNNATAIESFTYLLDIVMPREERTYYREQAKVILQTLREATEKAYKALQANDNKSNFSAYMKAKNRRDRYAESIENNL